MKNQFVTYEIALKLKELGFDEQCFGLYKKGKFYRDFEAFQWDDFSDCINAPLWQQVFDWFREKHNTQIEILWQCDMQRFCYKIIKAKVSYSFSEKDYKKYYEAREDAILTSIELIN